MAATGTPTTNLGLRIMNGTDPVDVADINANSQTLDSKIGAIPSGKSVQSQIIENSQSIAKIKYNANVIPSNKTVETYAYDLEPGFYTACNNSSATATAQGAPFPCPCLYYITVYTRSEHIQIICVPWNESVLDGDTIAVKRAYSGTWSGWAKLATKSEFTRQTASPTTSKGTLEGWSYVEKSGNIITLTFKLATGNSDISAFTEAINIPSAYRPSSDRNFYIATNLGTSTRMMQVQILTSGAVRCGGTIPANTDFGFTVTYIK